MPRAKTKPKKPKAKNPPGYKAVKSELVVSPGQPTLYRPEYAQMLEDYLGQGNSYETFVTVLPRNPGTNSHVCIKTLYNWETEHPEFLQAKNKGNQARVALYENAARNLAMGIIPPPPTDKDGNPIGMMTKGNAAMCMFMLCNIAPEKYRNRWYRDDSETTPAGADPEIDRDPVINFNLNRLPEPKKEE